jgi:hypothetical protein
MSPYGRDVSEDKNAIRGQYAIAILLKVHFNITMKLKTLFTTIIYDLNISNEKKKVFTIYNGNRKINCILHITCNITVVLLTKVMSLIRNKFFSVIHIFDFKSDF